MVKIHENGTPLHRFELNDCQGLARGMNEATAYVFNDELWELHINGLQKVRYERKGVKAQLLTYIALLAWLPISCLVAFTISWQPDRLSKPLIDNPLGK
jgi:hypothetical protein